MSSPMGKNTIPQPRSQVRSHTRSRQVPVDHSEIMASFHASTVHLSMDLGRHRWKNLGRGPQSRAWVRFRFPRISARSRMKSWSPYERQRLSLRFCHYWNLGFNHYCLMADMKRRTLCVNTIQFEHKNIIRTFPFCQVSRRSLAWLW